MKITLPKKTEEGPLFLVEDGDHNQVFVIERDGIVKYMTPEGVLETVANIEALALAFVGTIHAILANPDTNKKGVEAEPGAVKVAVKEMKAVLAKLENTPVEYIEPQRQTNGQATTI